MTDGWALATRAAAAAGVALRPLASAEDAAEIARVIEATWGEQPVGPEIVRALADSGTAPYGAFAGDRLVGFVLGWIGVDDEGFHVHSHMLATLPAHRHAGVGYALKLAQRAQALDRGVHLARWTYDPLVARNAHLNLAKLGAVADRFQRSFYGEMADEINRGDRSDRFTVRWDLRREPGGPIAIPPTVPTALARTGDPDRPEPSARAEPHPPIVVEIPPAYHELRAADPALGRAWRDAVAEVVEAAMAEGARAVTFDRARAAYLLALEGD
jgi:predicted GNAT superfamily acetyltransferase